MTTLHELDRTIRLVREFVPDDISDEKVIRSFQSFRILCVADAANLSTHAGQTALTTFISLAARMGVQVDLDIPEVNIIGRQPLLRGSWLKQALIDLGEDLILGSWIRGRAISPPNLVFIFGDTPYLSVRVPAWRLSGSVWAGRISEASAIGNRWTECWPIGAMTAAALASGEVFKAVVLSMVPGDQFQQPPILEPTQRAMWDFGSDCPTASDLDCGFIDLVSAGAINQAVMYVLMRIPRLRFSSRVFDDDIVDLTTINRGALTRRSDVYRGRSKAGIVAQYARSQAIPERLDRRSVQRYLPLAPSVFVGVDEIPSRWEIQRWTRGWLGVGGTSHFGTMTSSHSAGEPCAGCLHPIDDPGNDQPLPTVSFVSFWAGLSLAVRFLRYKLGKPYDAAKQYLWLVPLQTDDPNVGWWSLVAPRKDCPVRCGTADTYKARVNSLGWVW